MSLSLGSESALLIPPPSSFGNFEKSPLPLPSSSALRLRDRSPLLDTIELDPLVLLSLESVALLVLLKSLSSSSSTED